MQGLTNPGFNNLPGSPQIFQSGLELQYSLYILYIFLGKWNKKSLAQQKFGLVPGNWAVDLSGPEMCTKWHPCIRVWRRQNSNKHGILRVKLVLYHTGQLISRTVLPQFSEPHSSWQEGVSTYFAISQQKHMLWVLIRSASKRHF